MFAERIGSTQLAELSARGASLSGSLRTGESPRLAEAALTGAGIADEPLAWDVSFARGGGALAMLAIRVSGALYLRCQRCLGPVRWPVDVDVTLTAVPDEARADELPDPFDSVLLDEEGALPLAQVIEDEVLATLPLAPLHADADCAVAPLDAEGPASPPVTRPFAGLGSLLKQAPGGEGEK